jgi:hypothetical protein
MAHIHGVADGGRAHLPCQVGRPIDYPAGPFATTMAPTMRLKLSGNIPEQLFLMLLTKAPDADGNNFIAAVHDPVPVVRVPMNGTFDTIQHAVQVDLGDGVGAVTHAGLFNEGGELQYYGYLSGYRKSQQPARSFEFRAYEIKLRRFHMVDTTGPRRALGGSPWDGHPQRRE